MTRPAGDRIPCVVVGCRRTADASKYEPNTIIICGKCYRLAPRHLRQRFRRLGRILHKLGYTKWLETAPGSPQRRACILHSKVFDQITARATEARMGIG